MGSFVAILTEKLLIITAKVSILDFPGMLITPIMMIMLIIIMLFVNKR